MPDVAVRASTDQPGKKTPDKIKSRRKKEKKAARRKREARDREEGLDPLFHFDETSGDRVDMVSVNGSASVSGNEQAEATEDSTAAKKAAKNLKRKHRRQKKMREAGETDSAAPSTTTEQVENVSPEIRGDTSSRVDTPAAPTPTGLAEGDDFIPFNFDDSDEGDAVDPPVAEKEDKPSAFAKVAAKLGKFVQESNDPQKRKRSENGERASRKRKREGPKIDPYPWLQGANYGREREPARILHCEMLDFVKYVGPTEEEHRVRTFVISRIQKLVEAKWPTASLHVFGSFETKLYLPTSDIDLVVLSGADGEIYEKPNHLRRLANWLVKARIAEKIEVITSARVPIIKFIDTVTKINVDISFNKPSGLVAAGVVKRYTETMPALRPLVVFIKHFLNMRGMNEVYAGGLGSYSIICMVISFLQRHPKIATGQILQVENLGVLVVEFFELYGKRFNYDQVGIDITGDGKYFSKVDYGWQRPNQQYLLSIQDPTDPENDIAKSSFGILKVKSTFGGGHDFLVQRLYDVNDRIKERQRADVGLDSILSAVVSIDEDMKHSRDFIASCFESDVVQEELTRMEESEGEVHEVPSFDPYNLVVDRPKKARHTQFVAEDESSDEDDLIDNDGHKFVRPQGYKKPMNPGDVDDLYSKLNSAPGHPAPTATKDNDNDEVYLIESSDDDAHQHTKGKTDDVIDLDSDVDVEDSRVAQVEKGARARYWEAKGKESLEAKDEYESMSEPEA